MRYIQSTCILLGLTLGWGVTPPVSGDELELRYQREVTTERPSMVRPAVPELPAILRLSAVEGRVAASSEIDTRAGIAALLAALDRAESAGRRASYRLGFFDGLKTADNDPVLGRWDYEQGTRQGDASRWAAELGSDLGAGEARRSAEAAAYGHVTVAFSAGGATRSTAGKPRPVAPPFAASAPAVRAPRVEDLLRESTVTNVLERLPSADLAGIWDRSSVMELYLGHDRDEVYESRWAEASGAFEEWFLDGRNQDSWQRLDRTEQAAFRAAFEHHFRTHLTHVFATVGAQAYRAGFGDGWDYGAFLNREWSFRQGFTDGFLATVRATAEATFYERYPRFYDARYRQLYRERTVARASERGVPVRAETTSYAFEGDL